MKLSLMEVLLMGVLVLAASLASAPGCSTLQTQHQKIGAACETIATGVEAATLAKQAGRISRDQLQQVVDVAKPTERFCQPVAQSLNASDYAALIGAAARVAASPGATP